MFLALLGRHGYSMTPEQETFLARLWLVAGFLLGLAVAS